MKTCKLCGSEARARGLCALHLSQKREEKPPRASPGAGGQATFRLGAEAVETVRALALAEGIDPAEWYRRAVTERIARQDRKRAG
jgi:hypothetical protein